MNLKMTRGRNFLEAWIRRYHSCRKTYHSLPYKRSLASIAHQTPNLDPQNHAYSPSNKDPFKSKSNIENGMNISLQIYINIINFNRMTNAVALELKTKTLKSVPVELDSPKQKLKKQSLTEDKSFSKVVSNKWTAEEDNLLREGIKKFAHDRGMWNKVSELIGTRSKKGASDRWRLITRDEENGNIGPKINLVVDDKKKKADDKQGNQQKVLVKEEVKPSVRTPLKHQKKEDQGLTLQRETKKKLISGSLQRNPIVKEKKPNQLFNLEEQEKSEGELLEKEPGKLKSNLINKKEISKTNLVAKEKEMKLNFKEEKKETQAKSLRGNVRKTPSQFSISINASNKSPKKSHKRQSAVELPKSQALQNIEGLDYKKELVRRSHIYLGPEWEQMSEIIGFMTPLECEQVYLNHIYEDSSNKEGSRLELLNKGEKNQKEYVSNKKRELGTKFSHNEGSPKTALISKEPKILDAKEGNGWPQNSVIGDKTTKAVLMLQEDQGEEKEENQPHEMLQQWPLVALIRNFQQTIHAGSWNPEENADFYEACLNLGRAMQNISEIFVTMTARKSREFYSKSNKKAQYDGEIQLGSDNTAEIENFISTEKNHLIPQKQEINKIGIKMLVDGDSTVPKKAKKQVTRRKEPQKNSKNSAQIEMSATLPSSFEEADTVLQKPENLKNVIKKSPEPPRISASSSLKEKENSESQKEEISKKNMKKSAESEKSAADSALKITESSVHQKQVDTSGAPWDESEIAKFKVAYNVVGEDWDKVAKAVTSRNPQECHQAFLKDSNFKDILNQKKNNGD
ncbi:hypothetical protein G9A89_023472 [Geosiphon pyriformis]|nr:hypothetical protein G9A89_023472 [Geosiphon pyriformis]